MRRLRSSSSWRNFCISASLILSCEAICISYFRQASTSVATCISDFCRHASTSLASSSTLNSVCRMIDCRGAAAICRCSSLISVLYCTPFEAILSSPMRDFCIAWTSCDCSANSAAMRSSPCCETCNSCICPSCCSKAARSSCLWLSCFLTVSSMRCFSQSCSSIFAAHCRSCSRWLASLASMSRSSRCNSRASFGLCCLWIAIVNNSSWMSASWNCKSSASRASCAMKCCCRWRLNSSWSFASCSTTSTVIPSCWRWSNCFVACSLCRNSWISQRWRASE
mmetsp:Transcript_56429/g.112117  ORF Transcript_56429/g.112117 Transcript_56429/m.112117 type:complete len:281 (+) Transcript_56429:670-1512(+)